MKKAIFATGAITVVAGMFFAGCASTESQEERLARTNREIDEFVIGSKVAEVIPKTFDRSIDALAANSSIVYKRTGVAMREYVQETRGFQSVRDLSLFIYQNRKSTEKEIKDEADEIVKKYSAQSDTTTNTPEKLIALTKKQIAFNTYLYYRIDLDKAENKAEFKKQNETEEVKLGRIEYRERFAKTDWNAKMAELKKLLKDSEAIARNLLVLTADVTKKIQIKTQEIAQTMQNPAMQKFLQEVAPLKAQKTFANEARCKEIDAQISAIAEKPAYKPLMARKDKLERELENLKKNSSVLSDGVGKQTKFTAKAIPWTISQWSQMQEYGKEE